MNKENAFINIYAGRPGSGKTLWARQEIAALMGDANNFVVYIGHADEMNYLEEMTKEKPGKLFLSKDTHFGQTIGTAIDMANYATENESSDESEEMQNNRKQVYIFCDQCRYSMGHGYRNLLVAAAQAGICVNVLCQRFSQVSRGNSDWLAEHGNCLIIAKGKAPRLAESDEVHQMYA